MALTSSRRTTFMVCAGLAATFSACERGSGWVEVHQRSLVGSELRLLLTTSRHYRPPLSHSSKVADVQGWLLIVDIASDAPLQQRARLVGPLWESSTARSLVNFAAGGVFTSADQRAARETPGFTFDRDGALLRFRRAGKEQVRERLELRAAGPSWARLGTVRPIEDRTGPGSEDRVESSDRRHALIRQNGRAQLFDLFTGERVDDPWLTTAFEAVRSIPQFENVRYFLTGDLRHLVVNPVTVYNDGTPGGDGVRTFEWDGRTYRRAETALVFSRPDPRAKVLVRPNDPERFRDEPPNEAFVDDGELLLFDSRPAWMRLFTVDGREMSRVDAAGQAAWPSGLILETLHLPDTNEVAQRYQPEGTSVREATEQFVLWNYGTGSIARHTVAVGSLFEADGARLRPSVPALAVPR